MHTHTIVITSTDPTPMAAAMRLREIASEVAKAPYDGDPESLERYRDAVEHIRTRYAPRVHVHTRPRVQGVENPPISPEEGDANQIVNAADALDGMIVSRSRGSQDQDVMFAINLDL
jgi:hypothetical protein